jgi:broad specificity phosphatase PhoE
MKKLLIILCFLAFNVSAQVEKPTIIYLVRHAEKVTTDATAKDPLLTEKGQKRALTLAKKLKKEKLNSIYSTDYQRTKLTAQPIAEKQNVVVKLYDAKQLKAFAQTILAENKGKKVLVVGHSNTVLETIESLGGQKPIASITDNEYDYFFIVKIDADGVVEVKFERYGDKNTSSEATQIMKVN